LLASCPKPHAHDLALARGQGTRSACATRQGHRWWRTIRSALRRMVNASMQVPGPGRAGPELPPAPDFMALHRTGRNISVTGDEDYGIHGIAASAKLFAAQVQTVEFQEVSLGNNDHRYCGPVTGRLPRHNSSAESSRRSSGPHLTDFITAALAD